MKKDNKQITQDFPCCINCGRPLEDIEIMLDIDPCYDCRDNDYDENSEDVVDEWVNNDVYWN